jgi:hypothetical protein
MNLEKSISILKDDIIKEYDKVKNRNRNKALYYNLYDYYFNDIFPNMHLSIFVTHFTYGFNLLKDPDSRFRLICYSDIHHNKNLGDKISEMLVMIYNLKNDYEYSKVLDEFLIKKDKCEVENTHLAKLFITHQKINDCVVCYDPNTVKTTCEHSLCRECLFKLTKNECPMCKRILI